VVIGTQEVKEVRMEVIGTEGPPMGETPETELLTAVFQEIGTHTRTTTTLFTAAVTQFMATVTVTTARVRKHNRRNTLKDIMVKGLIFTGVQQCQGLRHDLRGKYQRRQCPLVAEVSTLGGGTIGELLSRSMRARALIVGVRGRRNLGA